MTENPELPPPSSASTSRRSWILVAGVLAVAALSATAYILRYESPTLEFLGRTTQSSSDLSVLEQKLASLETLLKETERPIPSPPTPAPAASPDLTAVAEAIKKLEERLAEVENRSKGDQQDVRRFVAEAFAFWELREAARSDLNFEKQLATFRASAADDPTVAALAAAIEPYAASGVSTVPTLRLTLAAVEKETPLPAPAEAQSSIWGKIKAAFQPLIAVRPEKDARFAALEKALDAGNLNEALEAARALPPEAQATVQPWRTKLESRIVVDNTLAALSSHFLEPPTLEKTP